MSLIIKKNTTFKIPRTAPSGFPNVEANGQQINVSTSNEFAGIYTKVLSGNEAGYINASRVYNGPYVSNGDFVAQLVFNVDTNQWELGGVADWTGDGNVWQASRFNPSSNQNIIPTTGWNESVTITAA
jgi:hypothetical protein